MMPFRPLSALAALLVLLGTTLPTPASAQSRDLDSYVLFGIDQLRTNEVEVVAGDLGVNDGLFVNHRALIAPASAVVADTARIYPTSVCSDVFSNRVLQDGPACGGAEPFESPLLPDVAAACGFPDPFPECDEDSPPIVIPYGGVVRLDPGRHPDVVIMDGTARLVLKGGDYTFCSIRAAHGQIFVEDPATVNVRRTFVITRGTIVGPAPSSGLVPGDVRFFAEASRVRVIRQSIMYAHLCAPNATVHLSMGTTLKGRFVGRSIHARRIHAQLASGTSTVTTTTTSSTTTIPSCGNGHVEAGEECDPPGSLTCGPGSALGAFLDGSPIGVFLECLADCTCPTTTTSTTVPTTTTTSTTSTTLPGDRCGNGVVDEGEQCDPAAAPSCGTGLACGAAGTAGACTCVPPGGSKFEVCGNCADDDGNGLTDFEDPACCARAQTVGLILRRGRIKTLGAGASRLKLRTKAVSGLASVNPLAQDVFVQIRPADGTDILCAQIPASTFRKKRGAFRFRDRSHLVTSARGLERVTIRVKRNGSARLRAAGRSVQMAAPPPGRLQVTLGFRNAAQGDAQNRCSKTTATFRGVRRGLKAP